MKHKYLLNLVFAFFICLLLSFSAQAQMVEFSSSANPVGSGARATGMGGAFIGVADDATAASWNPGGLVQLEKPEFSVVYSHYGRYQEFHSADPDIDGTASSMTADSLNYMSFAYPFVLFNRNVIFSMNYQRLYDMNKNYDLMDSSVLTFNGRVIKSTDYFDFNQNGYLYTLSPAVGVQVRPGLYVGATLNFWGEFIGENGWSSTNRNRTVIVNGARVTDLYTSKSTSVAFRGTNANLGVLWNVAGPWTVGAVYKTPFDARLRGEQEISQWNNGVFLGSSSITEKMRLKMPDSYGVGVSYHPNDALTVDLDVYRTNWSRFTLVDEAGDKWNPVTAKAISEGRLDDTTQVRLGAEYLFIKERMVFPVRAGVFYDPEPQTGSVDDYYGFTVGTGYAGGNIAVDISYQFRFANEIKGDLGAPIPGIEVGMKQHTVNASVIFYFQ